MGNTKIVISSGPTNTVKIMELSSKFSWPSVLRYDDEFHILESVNSLFFFISMNKVLFIIKKKIIIIIIIIIYSLVSEVRAPIDSRYAL